MTITTKTANTVKTSANSAFEGRRVTLANGERTIITLALPRVYKTKAGVTIRARDLKKVGRGLKQVTNQATAKKAAPLRKKRTAVHKEVTKPAPVSATTKTKTVSKAKQDKAQAINSAFKAATTALKKQKTQATSLAKRQARINKQQAQLNADAKILAAKEAKLMEAMTAITEAHKAGKTPTAAMLRRLEKAAQA